MRHARLLRASVITVVIIALSSLAHVTGGGSLPEPAIVVGLAALTMLAVTMAAKRTLPLPALTLILGAAQVAFHHLFGMLSSTARCEAATHAHHAIITCATDTIPLQHQALDAGPAAGIAAGTAAGTAAGLGTGIGAAMFAAHVLATLVTAVVITRGEQAVHATLAWLKPLFSPLKTTAITPTVRLSIKATDRALATPPYLVAPPLRGPPVTSH